MPCMNSTSADDRGGKRAFVDEGNVLLGMPGAPGCTTTGFSGGVCCERANKEKEGNERIVTRKMQLRDLHLCASSARCRRRICLHLDMRWGIFIWKRTKSCHESRNFSKSALAGPVTGRTAT